MSMKLRALLLDNYRAKVEQAYMHSGEAIVLQNVPCEMDFEAISGWVEHESEKHNYLPLFHLTGRITGIHGNFPYNVSSLTFAESDIDTYLQKDILYYMSPKELAHLIEVGKFFTNKFELPDILTRNTYSFPVMVNLTIVPPPNPAAYEQASYELGLSDNSINGIDKDNLPIFYIGFAGTGVNRKKDKLLDYYGIDFDEDFPLYALTAESSGYTQPTLMEYVTEPVEEVQEQVEAIDEMYVTPEEEAAMLKQREEQKEDVPQFNPQDDYQMDAEDILLAQADKNIERRIEKIRATDKSRTMQRDVQATREQQRSAEHVQSKQVGRDKESALSKLADLERMMKQGQAGKSGAARFADAKKTENKPVFEVKEEKVVAVDTGRKSEQMDVHTVKEEPVVSRDVTESAMATNAEHKEAAPDVPQQYAEVKMDFNPEVNELLHPENGNKQDGHTDVGALESEEDDATKLRDAQGADVSDARLQAKVDEANVKENARQTAVDIQADIAEDGVIGDTKSDAGDGKHRDVSSVLEDVADAADAQKSENGYDATLGVSY